MRCCVQVRAPQPPVYVFVIDVSQNAVQSGEDAASITCEVKLTSVRTTGMVAVAARTILESLDRVPNADERTKVAFIAVSTSLHFFSLPVSGHNLCQPTRSLADASCVAQVGEAEPSMLVVSDLEDVYLPKPSDLMVNLTECRPAIESFLGRLSDMFKDAHTVGSALGPAMQAAHKMIVSPCPSILWSL